MKSANKSVSNGTAGIPVHFEISLPQDTPEYMAPAYYGCLRWALTFDPILERFKSDTGKGLPAARSPIEKMVDQATGHDPYEDFFRAFVSWFNENIWGAIDGPGEN